MSRPIKPRGHVQDRPSKDSILAVLQVFTHAVTKDIARNVCLSPRCARQHLYGLEESGEVVRIDEPLRPLSWCLPEHEAQARAEVVKAPKTHFIPREHVSNKAPARLEPGFDAPIVQIVRPVGQWRVDHAIAARSVFELGAM